MTDEVACVKRPISEVTEEQVWNYMRAMKLNKTPGPSGLTCDILKAAGDPVVKHISTAM